MRLGRNFVLFYKTENILYTKWTKNIISYWFNKIGNWYNIMYASDFEAQRTFTASGAQQPTINKHRSFGWFVFFLESGVCF